MNFSEALDAIEGGEKVTDGKSVLLKTQFRRSENEIIHAICVVGNDGENTQFMPTGSDFESNWEIIKEE